METYGKAGWGSIPRGLPAWPFVRLWKIMHTQDGPIKYMVASAIHTQRSIVIPKKRQPQQLRQSAVFLLLLVIEWD